MKTFSFCSKHIIILWTFQVSHCQMMTSLLYCTCVMVWSGVTPSINSQEYCVYYYCQCCIGKV